MSAIHGKCSVWFAFDIGQSIDLDRCTQLLNASSRVEGFELAHHAPSWFRFAPPPLRLVQRTADVRVGDSNLSAEVSVTLFEFGAVSFEFEFAFAGELEQWIELSCELSTSAVLGAQARERVVALLADIQSWVTRPGIAEVVEDYLVFRWSELRDEIGIEEHLARDGEGLARLLRAERGPLSTQEVADALATRASFQPTDLLLIDWNAALMRDDEPEDVLRVLEFANVQLLELRFLDAQLDRALDRAHDLLVRPNWRKRMAMFGLHGDLDRISTMQVDGAILFERVGNTLKLIGDQYLARVLRLASQRFRSSEWNATILRRLETLDGIYEKVHDHAAALRAEFLEWIIIVLIAFEIAWTLLGAR